MKCRNRLSDCGFSAGAVLLASFVFCSPMQTLAQVAGNPVSYNSTSALAPSTAYVDASVFSGSDICAKIYSALTASTTPSTGVVIDARGISSLTCTSTETPWIAGSNSTTKPSTVLFPAGTITISKTWVLPNETRIIGEGPSKTTIQTSSLTNNPMIQMGSSTICPSGVCTGVEVQDLALLGLGSLTGLSGISNTASQDLSFVRNVSMTNINGTGLSVSGSGAQNSGPYADISFSNSSPVSTTVCADINGVSTRGIHGLNCISTGSTKPSAALLLDASNNSIEDVSVQGFGDGILIGANATAQSDALINVAGATGGTNVIHISTNHTANNLSILGVATQGASHSIEDGLTNTTLSDATVAMYVLGTAVTAGGTTVGYSRFSTSPNVPTWGVVNSTPSFTGSCVAGSIITNLTGASGSTMWVCTGGSWTNVK